MKEVLLTNYATMFPGSFMPYVTAKEIEGKTLREVFWKCETCGERAKQEVRDGAIPEMVLDCSCQGNHSFGLDIWAEIAAAANKISLDEII